jgi:hypothetical protein
MYKQQELLDERTALLPTGIPNGVHEALRSIGYRRQTGQVQQRIGHEDQTPMFPQGFGTPDPIGVEPQRPLTVLITRVDGMISHDQFCGTRWGVLQRPGGVGLSGCGAKPLIKVSSCVA